MSVNYSNFPAYTTMCICAQSRVFSLRCAIVIAFSTRKPESLLAGAKVHRQKINPTLQTINHGNGKQSLQSPRQRLQALPLAILNCRKFLSFLYGFI